MNPIRTLALIAVHFVLSVIAFLYIFSFAMDEYELGEYAASPNPIIEGVSLALMFPMWSIMRLGGDVTWHPVTIFVLLFVNSVLCGLVIHWGFVRLKKRSSSQ